MDEDTSSVGKVKMDKEELLRRIDIMSSFYFCIEERAVVEIELLLEEAYKQGMKDYQDAWG